jgi:very-short-patch-repair endonuclease
MAFERDRERDAILAAAGFRSLRFSHRQVTTQPITVVRALRTGPPRSS